MNATLLTDPRALLTSLHLAAVQGADPFVRTRDAVARWLNTSAPSANVRIHLFALGKAGATMAAGAARALRDHHRDIAGGVVVAATRPATGASEAHGGALPGNLELHVGDHPVPDIGSLAAADVIARKVRDVNDGDIALVLLSGGTTSLCAAPSVELSEYIGHPSEAQQLLVTLIDVLHQRGLAIHEMNAIRRRLLRWGAGRLAVALDARRVGAIEVFAISDVIGDDPAVIGSGPCSPDTISDAEFLSLLDAYELRAVLPRKLSVALGLEGAILDVIGPPDPRDSAFDRVHYTIIARNRDATRALAQGARTAGIQHVVEVETELSGEAETLGHAIATLALRAASTDEHAQLIVWGGEPTVPMDNARIGQRLADAEEDAAPLPHTLNIAHDDAPALSYMQGTDVHFEQRPLGGRMQALALAASLALEQADLQGRSRDAARITIVAAGTDGRDGPTDACGAIVNAGTPWAARHHGRDPVRDLHRLRSYYALDAANALLKTGPTGTNVMDIVAAYISPAKVP